MWMPQITRSLLFLYPGVTVCVAHLLEWKVRFPSMRSRILSWFEARRLRSPASLPHSGGQEGNCAEERWLKGKLGTSEGCDGWRGRKVGLEEESWSHSSLSVRPCSAAVSWCSSSSLCLCGSSFVFLVLKHHFH